MLLRIGGAPDRYRKRSDSPHLVRRTLTCTPVPFGNIRNFGKTGSVK